MKKLMMLFISLAVIFGTVGSVNAFGELAKAKTAISVGEYDTAISFLKQIAYKGDLETNYYLGVAYLMDKNYDNKASEKFKAIAKYRGYPDKIAKAYIHKIAICENRWRINRYLAEAEKYCRRTKTRRRIANILLNKKVRNYKVRAARLIGVKEVFGFTKRWRGKDLIITFLVNKPVLVMKRIRAGQRIIISGKRSPEIQTRVRGDYIKILLNRTFTFNINIPLILKSRVGDTIKIHFL